MKEIKTSGMAFTLFLNLKFDRAVSGIWVSMYSPLELKVLT